MELSVRPALTTAPVVRGLDTDHDRRRGQRCTFLNRPVSLINRGKPVQMNRATSIDKSTTPTDFKWPKYVLIIRVSWNSFKEPDYD